MKKVTNSQDRTSKLLNVPTEELGYITDKYLTSPAKAVNDQGRGVLRYGYDLAIHYSDIWKGDVYVVKSSVP